MLGGIFSAIGYVSVRENDGKITINGFKTALFEKDITNIWNTSKVVHMLSKMTSYYVEFRSFYAIEFLYIVRQIQAYSGKLNVARRTYKKIEEELIANTWLNSIDRQVSNRLDYGAISRFTITPLEHQSNFLKTYDVLSQKYRLNGYILGAAPGSGKTIINFLLAEMTNAETVFILSPKNAIDRVWNDTINGIFKNTPSYWISSSGEPLVVGRKYYLFHYERLEEVYTFFKNKKLGRVYIGIDESHNFNDLKSNRTQMLCEFVKALKPMDVIFSSGTPVKAMGAEIIPILRCIDRMFTPMVEKQFRDVFGLSTTRAIDILANRMGMITYRVEKANVVGNTVHTYDIDVTMDNAKEYTLENIQKIMVSFIRERMDYYKSNLVYFHKQYFDCLTIYESTLKNPGEWTEYRQYRNYAATINKGFDPVMHLTESLFCNSYEKNKIIPALPQSMRDTFKNVKSIYKYYHLKVQGEALGRILGRMRTNCNLDMIWAMDNYVIRPTKFPLGGGKIDLPGLINQGAKKTVIFTSYVEVVLEADKLLRERGFNPVLIYGETNKNLAQLIENFAKDPDLNPIVATYQSLSTAVPLVMANQCVMLNAPFRIHEYDQATSRVDRLGQTEIVNIFNIYLNTGNEANISTRSVDIMKWSKDQVNAILGISSDAPAIESVKNDDEFINAHIHLAVEAAGCEDLLEQAPVGESADAPVKVKRLGW